MRDGRRLFAGDEQRKGDFDFYNDDSSLSMEGKLRRPKILRFDFNPPPSIP
jgi:hypothetical protein